MAIRKSTQIKYWQMFEAYLKYKSILEIQLQFGCDRTTIFRALKYCRGHKLDLSIPEELEIIIEAKRRRLNRMLKRLDFLEEGWSEEKTIKTEDGTVTLTEVKGKFNPIAEAAFYREIRELEKDIQELKGLYDQKTCEGSFKLKVKGYVGIDPDKLWDEDIEPPIIRQR